MTAGYLTDGSHLLLTGPTGSKTVYGGKTSLAAYLADNPLRERGLVVFLNVKHDDLAGVLEGYREVGSIEELADAMADGHRRIIVTPRDPDWEAVSERLVAFVRELPSDTSKAIILDEVPELDEDAVLTAVRVLGNGANCKSVLLSQSPTDVSTSIVKQVIPVWVGPVPSSYRAWFRSYSYAEAYEYIAESHDPYQWTVILGPGQGDWDHYDAVPEVYAV